MRAAAGGTARAAVADPDPLLGDAVTSAPTAAAPLLAPTWAAEAVIGFPQSMQNREVASFSRPQNEQAVNRQPPRREPSWRANIGSESGIRTVVTGGWWSLVAGGWWLVVGGIRICRRSAPAIQIHQS